MRLGRGGDWKVYGKSDMATQAVNSVQIGVLSLWDVSVSEIIIKSIPPSPQTLPCKPLYHVPQLKGF